MAYNYEYPYTDPHRYNADWLLNEVAELKARPGIYEMIAGEAIPECIPGSIIIVWASNSKHNIDYVYVKTANSVIAIYTD